MARADAGRNDEELAARAAGGDERAFEALVKRYQARAWRLAARLVGAAGDPQDAVQEAFLNAYRGLPRFRRQARFSTWLYRIVTNAALMQRRSRRRRPAQSLEQYLPRFDAEGRHAQTPAQLVSAARVEELLDRRALALKVQAGLERLPAAYRTPFVLRDLELLPTAEVAAVLRLEPATVRQRVHRARLMLRGYLGDLPGVKP